MPACNWTKENPGTVHDFHNAWNKELRNALNGGILPSNNYAQTHQPAGGFIADVLTLERDKDTYADPEDEGGSSSTAVVARKVSPITSPELNAYRKLQRKLEIRPSSGDHIVTIVEIVSEANKHSRSLFESFMDKVLAALDEGIHLVIIDLHSATKHNANGIHGALWTKRSDESSKLPTETPFTLVAYEANSAISAHVEPTAAGRTLSDMPLFLAPERYVNVPTEMTYMAAYEGVPRRWKRVIEGELVN